MSVMVRESEIALASPSGPLALLRIEPDDAQARPVVLMAHGAQGCKEPFRPLARTLAEQGWRVMVPDLRGHGASAGPRYHVEIQDWVADVLLWLDWIARQPDMLAQRVGGFGFSSGGTAVLEVAATQGRFRALVTLDATVRPVVTPLEQVTLKALGWAGRLKRRVSGADLHFPLYPFVRHRPLAFDPEINAQVFADPHLREGLWRYPLPGALDSLIVDTWQRVDRIQVPVCVLHGAEDAVDLPDSARLLYERLQGPKALHLLPDCGHVGFLDAGRARVAAHTVEWFARYL